MTGPVLSPTYDAIIVGARCAGAATGMLLAREGARVLVVDRDAEGADTLSTHALMRGAVMQLHRWGLLGRLAAAGTPPVRRTSFVYGEAAVDVDIQPLHGTDALYAPRRTVLDPILVAAAREAGATVLHRAACTGLVRGRGGRVTGIVLRRPDGRVLSLGADIVIGADGQRSFVARQLGVVPRETARSTAAVVYAYAAGLPDRGYRWFYADGAAGGILPTDGGLSCVFLARPPAGLDRTGGPWTAERMAAAIGAALPALAAELAGAGFVTRPRAFAGQPGHIRPATGAGWALVGDAGYFRDPLTAHGITDALRDAELLTRALAAGDPAGFGAERDALSRAHFEVTERIAGFGWRLADLPALHGDLNRAMKLSQNRIAGLAPLAVAA